jgi:DNA-binding MarR family transcriptional regulator
MTAGEPDALRLAHTANLLGALSLAVTDRTSDAAGEALGQSDSAAIALSALHHFLNDPSVDRLRQVLGLTASGTVRLVDRLEAAGYVTRRPGHDGRSVSVRLTANGRRAARRVTAARSDVLQEALSRLHPEEREVLDGIVSRMLAGMIRGPGATRWMCRMCDTTACGRDAGQCPAANAAPERYGSMKDRSATG